MSDSNLITEVARTPGGQIVAADSLRVFPARWNELHRALGSINDRFSVSLHRVGRSWIIPGPGVAFGQQRWSFERGEFIVAHTFGAETYCDDLDQAIAVAVELAEARTNVRGETFAQIAARLLDHLDDPDLTSPDIRTILERRREAEQAGVTA